MSMHPQDTWQQQAIYFREQGCSWTEIANKIASLLPQYTHRQLCEKIRCFCTRTYPCSSKVEPNPCFPSSQMPDQEVSYRASIEGRSDGTTASDRIIEICEGEELTPELLLSKHNLDPSKWTVLSYKNNYWHSQVKGGTRLVMYQSKLIVQPKYEHISEELLVDLINDLAEEFSDLQPKGEIHRAVTQPRSCIAELNVADLHLGKYYVDRLTENVTDSQVIEKIFKSVLDEACEELVRIQPAKIVFVWSNDFFNSDNPQKTTFKGTPQCTDLPWDVLFKRGVKLLVWAIERLKKIAPVETFYTHSNHDKTTSFYAAAMLSAWYRQDDLVTVDYENLARVYRRYGNTLVCYTHGEDKRPCDLAALVPMEAPIEWTQTKFREVHAAHLHAEKLTEETNGVIVRRVSALTGDDDWLKDSGYVGSTRQAQLFVYDPIWGLKSIIYCRGDRQDG